MVTDEQLKQWRDAVVSRGLPAPTRADRWQPLRAGVVNLWEFEVAEYWYADGWVQLTGRNETGKSSLMALTTLIPWLADTSSTNIDTLSTKGKQFRYYVGPSGEPGDRRSADTSTHHGWLWVEYGRQGEAGPEFFTSLLFAASRSAASQLTLTWCTLAGSARVRGDLHLLADRTVVQPKEITVPGFQLHPTAGAYKAEVATRLLGSTTERLESVGRILKVTRTPKLGEQLKISFLQEHLRAALPELNRDEVDKLAEGWDQLDQIREDLRRAQHATSTVESFLANTWRPWAQAVLRLAADRAAVARTRFDHVTKTEREAQRTLASAEEAQSTVRAAQQEAAGREEQLRTAGQQLSESAQYRSAQARLQNLQHAEQEARTRADVHARAGTDHAEAGRSRAAAVAALERQQTSATAADELAHRCADDVRTAARTAHLSVEGEVDAVLLRQQAKDRDDRLGAARRHLRAAEQADRAAEMAERTAEVHADNAASSRTAAEQAWAQAEGQRDELARALDTWAGALRWPVAVEPLQAALPTRAAEAGRLQNLVREGWHQELRRGLDAEAQHAVAALEEAEARSRALGREVARLEAEGATAPEPPTAWLRRERPADGAPLWQLINPAEGLGADALAALEAALAAAGALDAWVDASGLARLDTLIEPGTTVETNLTRVLTPAPGQWSDKVQRFLSGVHLVEAEAPLPAAGFAVALDGRWRNSGLTGHAEATHGTAEWIGEAAREAQRRRLIAELTAQREASEEAAGVARMRRDAALAEAAELDEALAAAPTDTGLGHQLARAEDAEVRAEQDEARAERADEGARRARAEANTVRAQFIEFTSDHGLPTTHEGLDAEARALGALRESLHRLNAARDKLAEAQQALAREGHRLAEADARLAQAAAQLAEAEGELHKSQATVAELRAAVGADDQQVLDRLRTLKAQEELARSEARALVDQLQQLAAERAQAQTQLTAATQARAEATQARDDAYRHFRRWIDAEFDLRLQVELPARDSTGVQPVREQVAVVRDKVRPRGWQEEPEADEELLGRRRDALILGTHATRTELESGGRSLRLNADSDDLPITVIVDTHGTALPLHEARARLADIHAELNRSYDAQVQRTLDEFLGSAFLGHLRTQVESTVNLIKGINAVLREHATGTDATAMRIELTPREDLRDIVRTLETSALVNPEVAGQVRDFLKRRVDEAKSLAAERGDASWQDRLAEQLDYRTWYDVHLQHRRGTSGWRPLTSAGFAKMSGGARAVMLMMPLVATLAALYAEMDSAPRPLWLDEAFDGLDAGNRSMVMRLLRSFDLDVLVVGPGRLVNVEAVPTAAIYQVVRAPAPEPGADLTLELWAGGSLEAIELPLDWDGEPEAEADDDQDMLL